MKKYLITFALLFAAVPASAATTITTVADQSVFVGDTVTVDVVVNRTKTGFPANDLFNLTNDWQSTEIDGVCFNTPNLILGTGVATTSYQLSASSTLVATTTEITVKVFRLDGCDDNLGFPGKPSEDSTSFELEVKEVPVVVSEPSSPSEKKSHGGGLYMGPVYYGFTSEADKARFATYEGRQALLGQWRWRMCQQYGFACGK